MVKFGWSISEAGGLVKSTFRIVIRALDKNESVSLANLSVNKVVCCQPKIKTILIREDEC